MGHGKSITEQSPRGYFTGGWFGAVEDTVRLMKDTMVEFPGVPYILFGHSMGSFMARTILAKYPDSGIAGAIICGTGWQPAAVLTAGSLACKLVCRTGDARKPSKLLHAMAFGTYNSRIEHPRIAFDWLSRDKRIVDAYEADPLCGFMASAGLMGDMMEGIAWIQNDQNMASMKKDLPVFFVAGGDDPVGAYGSGVLKAVEMFKKWGMERVDHKIYPLCRHEILNEINRMEIYENLAQWIKGIVLQPCVQFSDLLGKVLLVGITYYTHDEQLIEQKQYYGEVVVANEEYVQIRRENGELFALPPDLRSTHPAQPGEYKLRSTGEIVVNPDYLATWQVFRPEPEKE